MANDRDSIKDWTEKSGTTGTTGRARSKEQFAQMVAAEEKGVCIFCDPAQWENPPFMEGGYWLIKKNDYPYENHREHLVIIWKNGHLEDIRAIPTDAWEELAGMLDTLQQEHELPAINFVMRFGDPDLRSSTIHHIHGHVQIPSDDVIPREKPPAWENSSATPLCWGNALVYGFRDPAQFKKLLIISRHGDETKHTFTPLIKTALEMISLYSIKGGGIVFRIGDRRYTNAKTDSPNLTIYAPNGTGRVHATFVPPRPGKTKPVCKATFCKGFEGDELEKLRKRMEEFTREE